MDASVVQMATPELDKVAKEFAPPAEKSYIYVMRKWAYIQYATYMIVVLKEWVDNKRIYERAGGFLLNSTYVLFEVPPGQYEVHLASSREKTFRLYFGLQKIKLVILPGHTYFIASQFGLSMLSPDPTKPFYAEILPKADGKKAILDYERVATLPLN